MNKFYITFFFYNLQLFKLKEWTNSEITFILKSNFYINIFSIKIFRIQFLN
jgi:hypothetical protein